jgi:hypothetical protein
MFESDLPAGLLKLPRLSPDGQRMFSSVKWVLTLYNPNPFLKVHIASPYVHLPRFDNLLENWAREGILVTAQFCDSAYNFVQTSDTDSEWKDAGILNPRHLVFIDTPNRVDVLHNPGRVEYHSPINYQVAHKMWLGPEFWEITGADREAVLRADWLTVHEFANGTLRIQAWPEPFIYDLGEQRVVQEKLWELLFPKRKGAPAYTTNPQFVVKRYWFD